jgi:hypothetical protein
MHPVVLLLSLEEGEAMLLVSSCKIVPVHPSRLQTLADHRRGGLAQPVECEQDGKATGQRPCDVQRLR